MFWEWNYSDNRYYFNGIDDYLETTIDNSIQTLGDNWSIVFGIRSGQIGTTFTSEGKCWIEKKVTRVIM